MCDPAGMQLTVSGSGIRTIRVAAAPEPVTLREVSSGCAGREDMNSKILIEWIERQGYHVVNTTTSYWYEIMPRIYQAVPFHHLIAPSSAECDQLLRRERALAFRYSTALEADEGKISYHVVNRDKEYDITQLSKSTRYDVRKGLRYAGVEPISLKRLASEGWALRQETLARQGRSGAETASWWERLCKSAEGLPGFEAWGAVRGGRLMASILTITVDDCCVGLYQQCCVEALTTCVNNTLTYSFTKEVLSRPGINQVFYGLHSLDADEKLDTFKFRMGYVVKPVRQRIVMNYWMRRLLNGISYRLLLLARRRWPEWPTIAKAEGMARFYLEGRRPLAKQIWPECLKSCQAELLGSKSASSAGCVRPILSSTMAAGER